MLTQLEVVEPEVFVFAFVEPVQPLQLVLAQFLALRVLVQFVLVV